MLYERWRQVARERRNETALSDLAGGGRWTFAALAAEAERECEAGPVVFPQGARFVFMLLRAWRSGRIACPLDAGQTPPALEQLPPGCAHLKMTSATTGSPRLVAFTEEQLAADAENIVATMGLRPEWPNLGVISLAHSYGFSNLVLPLLLHGVPLILADGPLPESVRRAAAMVDDLTLAAVPAMWRAWHEAGAVPDNVRLAISAGAPLPLALEQSVFAMNGLKIHNFYGASECGGIAYDGSAIPRVEAACAGEAMKNVSLAVGADGCLEVRGRAVGESYWPEPDRSLGGGHFHTCDLAEIWDGRVYLLGRLGDQINIAGRKLSPDAVEEVLRAHPRVRECLVFGAPSPEDGRTETIVAYVSADAGVDAGSLREFLLGKLPAWQVPREWVFAESLGANHRGKLSRAEWRRKFLERQT